MAEEKKGGFFSRLVSGLTKTRDNIVSGMDSIFHGFTHIDDDFYEELEEVMIMGDLGVQATYDILDDLKEKVKERHIKEPADCRDRSQAELIGGQEGSDPASVVFDAVAAAKARHADVLLCDTAGRLHNKKNLMEELRKMNRIIDREFPEAYRETLVVLDATTGQNALQQAKDFNDVADITGIVLTKMDGTAKGGIAVAIQAELGIPVKYIGVGETIDDLQKFDADAFVNALFAKEDEN